MAKRIIAAVCDACGAKLTLEETLERDPLDDSCPKCGEDTLTWLLDDDPQDVPRERIGGPYNESTGW